MTSHEQILATKNESTIWMDTEELSNWAKKVTIASQIYNKEDMLKRIKEINELNIIIEETRNKLLITSYPILDVFVKVFGCSCGFLNIHKITVDNDRISVYYQDSYFYNQVFSAYISAFVSEETLKSVVAEKNFWKENPKELLDML